MTFFLGISSPFEIESSELIFFQNVIESKTENVAVIGEDAAAGTAAEASREKYVVKSGDTLNGIAYRFYGKYNEAKIQEIQKINEIANPAALKVGQELLIPVER